MSQDKSFGMVAMFESSGELLHAADKLSEEGYKNFDAHSPFPIHGMDDAMRLPQSILGLLVFLCGVTGCITGFALQIWVHNYEYPLVFAGKPFLSIPAFVPVAYELTILFSAFGAVFGMFGLNKLPMPYHAVFNHPRFSEFSNDKFFIAVEATDPKFSPQQTKQILEKLGGKHVELVAE